MGQSPGDEVVLFLGHRLGTQEAHLGPDHLENSLEIQGFQHNEEKKTLKKKIKLKNSHFTISKLT